MLNTRLDHAFRNPQPVLVVISCLCLCLGSCFPSSEPLNRIPATQSKTSSSGGQTVQTTAATVTAATASNKVFSLNSDPRFRNMDTVVQDRLDSVGQVSLSTTSATLLVNSTRGASDSLPSASSSSSSSTASPPSSSKNDRQRQRQNLKQKKNKSTRERSHFTQKSKSKKRRLSSERKGKTRQQEQQQLGLDARAGRRNRRMKRIDCARLAQRSKRIRQLENSISFFLAVYPDGTINGTHNRNDRHTLLSFVAYRRGFIRIYGEIAGRFICMNNQTGEVYSAEHSNKECIFHEKAQPLNLMYTYSLIHSPNIPSVEWYLGISKKGEVKNGRRVRSVLKIAHFLPAYPPEEIVC